MERNDPVDIARQTQSRRHFLGLAGATVVGSVAGCLDSEAGGTVEIDADPVDFEGSALTADGISWDELPELSGELEVYSGRREAQIGGLFDELESHYDELTINRRYEDNETHLSLIDQEGQNSPADVLYTQDSGTLGALKGLGRTAPLTADVGEVVRESWRDPDHNWTGVSGRTRCVAYNTDAWGEDDLPDDIFAYPDDNRFIDEMGWRVDSGSFLAWIRAIMIEHDRETASQYLQVMDAAGVTDYTGGSTTPEALAAGEVTVGFVNHYYIGRLLADQPDVPVDVSFTDGDIGSLFNVSGAAVLDSSDNKTLARNFIRHLLAREGQEFFVETNSEYALIEGVEYVGDLPSLDQINPPEFDLNQLADLEPAVDLLREVGLR